MRDINSQTTTSDQELYWYMNSGHVRTEGWRSGLQGPYAMTFSTAGSTPPATLDTSFFGSLKIDGYVGESGRGSVTGKTTGVPDGFETVVHFYNTNAQYWAKAEGGNYKTPLMKAGTYSVKLYKGEYLVNTDSVTVTAGQTATKDIASKEPQTPVIWRIGNFDGQPFELKNGDKITRMHPSDSRMGSWGGTYTVGTSKASDFPMAVWAKQSGAATVNFSLTKDQVKGHVLRIGTTLSFKGGRPSVKIGSWTGKDPGAPVSLCKLKEDKYANTLSEIDRLARCDTWSIPGLRRCLHLGCTRQCVQGGLQFSHDRCRGRRRCDLVEREFYL